MNQPGAGAGIRFELLQLLVQTHSREAAVQNKICQNSNIFRFFPGIHARAHRCGKSGKKKKKKTMTGISWHKFCNFLIFWKPRKKCVDIISGAQTQWFFFQPVVISRNKEKSQFFLHSTKAELSKESFIFFYYDIFSFLSVIPWIRMASV